MLSLPESGYEPLDDAARCTARTLAEQGLPDPLSQASVVIGTTLAARDLRGGWSIQTIAGKVIPCQWSPTLPALAVQPELERSNATAVCDQPTFGRPGA